ERPPRSSWRICANARSALLFTRQCCTWIRFSRTPTSSRQALHRTREERLSSTMQSLKVGVMVVALRTTSVVTAKILRLLEADIVYNPN
ncbi:hypothetical protein CN175_32360, partial [Sinorhizobium meliloti]